MPVVKLSNGKSYSGLSGQTLLESARSQGIALEHSCRTGRCGVCKAKVLSGLSSAIKGEECLAEEERASGVILTCCHTAETDIELDISDLGELASVEVKTLPCRIDRLEMLSGDVLEVVLRTPPASRLRYLPGQYVDVIGGGGLRRSYSVANSPREDGKIILNIRKVPDGAMSSYWFEEAKVNDLLRLEGPLGTFFLRQVPVSQLVLLATGTGMAPIRAMLEQLVESPNMNVYRQVHIYWGGRTEADLYWDPHSAMPGARFVPVLSRSPASAHAKGYVQDAVLIDGVDLRDSVVYACGSPSMIESAKNKLVGAGLKPERFFSDAFVSSN